MHLQQNFKTAVSRCRFRSSGIRRHVDRNWYQRFTIAFCLPLQGLARPKRLWLECLYPDKGGRQNLWNLGNYIPIGTVSCRRRLSKMRVLWRSQYLSIWCYGAVDRQDLMENLLKKVTLERSYVKFNSLDNFRCKFNVHGSVHRKYIPIYIQQDANLNSLFISGNCSTCFGCYFHPSSGTHTTVPTASGICHTVTATCRYRGGVGTTKQFQLFHDSGR